MDLKQLEYFTVTCECGSFSKAAACMYTSQPNVSKVIRALEHELGRPLLNRHGKGVRPTAFGKSVLEHARLMLKLSAAIGALALPDEREGLRISAYPSNMISRLLVDFYKEWGSQFPIEYHEGAVEEITDHVHQGISELAIVYVAQNQVAAFQHILAHKNLEFVPQDVKKLCVYVGPNHPLYQSDSIDFEELPRLKFIRGIRDFFSMEHHLEKASMGAVDTNLLDYIIYTNSDHFNINLLLHTDICNLGLKFMYSPYQQYDIKALEINGCEPFLQVGYVKAPDRLLSPQALWVIDRFREMLKNEL